jgi:hypothetical protein
MHNETLNDILTWSLILSIATRFDMHRIRARAIQEIETFRPGIAPVDQVVLAVKHNVPEWLPPAYTAICQRADPIDIEEARRLGLETTVLLAKVREKVRSDPVRPVVAPLPSGIVIPPPPWSGMVQSSNPVKCPETPAEYYPTRSNTPRSIYDGRLDYRSDGGYNCPSPSLNFPKNCCPRGRPFESRPISRTPSRTPSRPPGPEGRPVFDTYLVRHVVDETFWPKSVLANPLKVKVSLWKKYFLAALYKADIHYVKSKKGKHNKKGKKSTLAA